MKNDPFPGDAARACTDAFPTDHASQITKAETEWRSKEDFMQQSASLAGEIVRLKRELEAAEAALVAEKRAREEAAAIAKDRLAYQAQGYCKDAKHAESVADELRRLLEKEKERADKFMWQVRDTCARAEAAETHSAALARALEELSAKVDAFWNDPERPSVHRMRSKSVHELSDAQRRARSLLAPKEDTANG